MPKNPHSALKNSLHKNKIATYSYQEISNDKKIISLSGKHSNISNSIGKVCIIGAGVMGSGIAALLANASCSVILLDIPSRDFENRNSILEEALVKIKTVKPSSLTSPSRIKFIKIGNLEDDLNLISECDLVIEVIVEKIALKSSLYNKIIPFLKNGAILTSNTSTIPLKLLKEHLPDHIKSNFFITHFFNPPRYMELVEVIADSESNQESVKAVENFIEYNLGKTIVRCNDTPGFIANRVGCFLLELVVRKAIKDMLDPVIIDDIFTQLFKLPTTGIFGLYDLIGHDVLKLISDSLIKNLSEDDAYSKIYIDTPLLGSMLDSGFIGRKGKGGFYQISEANNLKTKKVISFLSPLKDYSAANWKPKYVEISKKEKVSLNINSIEEFLNTPSVYSKFFKEVLVEFYNYLFNIASTITNDISNIDTAIKLGYSWKFGPFELLNLIPNGLEWIIKESHSLGYKLSESSIVEVSNQIKKYQFSDKHVPIFRQAILSNSGGTLSIYKDSLVASIGTKMNCLNNDVFEFLLLSIDYAEKNNKDLYIYSFDSPNFSAGADLKFIIESIENKNFAAIDAFLKLGQRAMLRLKNSKINIISCAQGAALGGGCEILLHSDFIVIHSELKAGLVEVGAGLIPGWGGVKEMFFKSHGNIKTLIRNLGNIINSNKSSSADQFVEDYSISNYKIVLNKNRLLEEALNLDLTNKIVPYFKKVLINDIKLKDWLDIESLSDLQTDILSSFQELIDSKKISELELLEFERQKFLELCKKSETLQKLKSIIN